MSAYTIGVQLIGFIGTAFLVLSFQMKKTGSLFLMQLCGNACYAIQFFLLGTLTGCVSQGVGMLRNIFLIRKWKWMAWKGWAALLIALQVAITCFTWVNAFSLLPLIANAAAIIGGWTKNAKKVRVANMFFNSPAWLIYDIYAWSISGILCELFTQVSTIISIRRYGWKALDTTD